MRVLSSNFALAASSNAGQRRFVSSADKYAGLLRVDTGTGADVRTLSIVARALLSELAATIESPYAEDMEGDTHSERYDGNS